MGRVEGVIRNTDKDGIWQEDIRFK
jgi:hypothetical protein